MVFIALAAATIITAAFRADGSSGDPAEDTTGTPTASATRTPTRNMPTTVTTAKPPSFPTPTVGPTPTPIDFDDPPASLAGFAVPLAGACLPSMDALMPGAPREYRNGIHEGLDFYDSDNCVAMGLNAEIIAAKSGTVVRADHGYIDVTLLEIQELEGRAAAGDTDPAIEDRFRGRQIWIDHGNGVVTRYCHLNGIAEGIAEGVYVEQGQAIGYMGESGAPESVTAPGTQVHLHFELRINDGYLGQGLSPEQVREVYQLVFGY
jgi:murein DD-endopeptidase MepM/ murein hydrolase activator NlpD